MTKTYDDILSTEDLENLDSFLTAWERVTVTLNIMSGSSHDQSEIKARQAECTVLRRKLAVAIHYSKGGDRP